MNNQVPFNRNVPSRYVDAMCKELDLSLSLAQKAAHVAAASFVEMKHVPVLVQDIHRVMFEGLHPDVAGRYRTTLVVKETGHLGVLPTPNAVPSLMEKFQAVYEAVMTRNYPPEDPETVAFIIGATGRVIHPFPFGNTWVFSLIENHIRQIFGFSWRFDLPHKDDFERVRRQVKQTYADIYL